MRLNRTLSLAFSARLAPLLAEEVQAFVSSEEAPSEEAASPASDGRNSEALEEKAAPLGRCLPFRELIHSKAPRQAPEAKHPKWKASSTSEELRLNCSESCLQMGPGEGEPSAVVATVSTTEAAAPKESKKWAV